MEKARIVMSYDREADTVYISFGEPRKAVSEEIDHTSSSDVTRKPKRRWA